MRLGTHPQHHMALGHGLAQSRTESCEWPPIPTGSFSLDCQVSFWQLMVNLNVGFNFSSLEFYLTNVLYTTIHIVLNFVYPVWNEK